MSEAWGKRVAVVIVSNSEIFGDREGCFRHRVFVDFNSDLELFLGSVGKINKDSSLGRLFLRKTRFWILWGNFCAKFRTIYYY